MTVFAALAQKVLNGRRDEHFQLLRLELRKRKLCQSAFCYGQNQPRACNELADIYLM